MAKQVQDILVTLGIEGYEELAKLKSAFRGLDTTVQQSDAVLEKARKAILDYGKQAQNSEATLKGLEAALKGVRGQATLHSPLYTKLTQDIKEVSKAQRDYIADLNSTVSAHKKLEQVEQGAIRRAQKIAAIQQLATAADPLAVAGRRRTEFGDVPQAGRGPKGVFIAPPFRSTEYSPGTQYDRPIGPQPPSPLVQAARSARESARAMADAFSSPELLSVLNYFDAKLGALPNTAAGFAQKLSELQQVLANTTRSSENYATAALNVARVQREASAATQGLGAALIRDLNTGVAARSSKNLQEVISQLQAEMNELDTTTAQGSRRYAENANQVRGLQGELRELGNSYRHVADMATQAATAQQNAANAVMRNNYFNRAAVRQQEEALRELGQRVRTAVEGTPLALPAAGQTSAPGTGQAMSGGARRLRGQVEYTFQDPIDVGEGRQVPNYLRYPRYAQLRNLQTTAATGVPPAVGFSGRDPSIQRAIPAYKEAQQELSKVLLSSNNTIQSLEQQRNAWNALRSAIDPASSTFANATKRVQELDKRLDSLSAKQQKVQKRGLGAQGLTQIAGAAISGGIFGGPEGFLGGVAGGALGGVGGAFAGAAIGAQVAGLRQAAGAAAEYAAAINQQRRALSGVVDDSAAYQQSLAFIDQTSRALAIPQEQVTRNFTRLSASVLGAGGDVAAAQEAFAGIAAGIRGTGGSLADLDAALLATAQVFSKGKVSAEELRGQIGERLPGAFTLFAESIGKTPAELDKMLEQGRVTLDDFMKFVRTLDTEYGRQALAMAASTEAAGDRLKVAFGRMQEDVGKALLPIGAQFQSMFAEALDAVTPFLATALPMLGNAALEVAKNLDVLVATLGALATAALVNAAVNTTKLVAAFVSLTQAVLRARDAILASNAALLLNPWVALAAGVTAATVGLVRYYRAQKEVNDLINYGSGSTKELNDKKYELTKRLEEETGRLDAAIKRYGESGRVVDTLRKRVKDLEDQLNKVTGTHTVRLKLEREGYRFDDDGNVQSFQVEGVGSFNISGRGSKGQLVKGSSRSAFGAGDQKKQEEAAKSLLNAIDQREEAIAEARITREKQLADIRKQAIKQAESLEKGFAQQRIQLERDIAATRRQLSATQQDVAFEESALATSLSGGNVEALRAAQQITVAARERDEQRIQLEQKILDDQKANAESIEDFKKQTADTINEANVRYAEAIGKAQQQYAKAVAKIIEEGTGRSGKRLEAAGRLTAALLERATAQQAFTASIGVGITRKTEKGVSGYQAGARFFTSEEELIDTLTRLGYPNIAEPFIAAEKAIQAADSALAKLPTASISASTAVGAVSVDISDLNAKLAVSVANLNAFREQQAALSADLQSMQAYKDFAAAATNAAAPLGQTIRGQVQEIEAATKVRALRLSDGMSGQEATGYIQILQQEIAAAELLTSTYEAADAAAESQADKDRLKKMYEGVRDSIAEAAIQAKRLNEEINNVPSRLIIQDAILNTRDNLNDLTKTGNVVVTAANNIGDAFGDAFNKLITGAGSAKQVLADFFQSVANSFFKMAQEIIGQLMVMITLQAVGKIFGLAGSAAGAAGASTAPVSGIQPGESFNLSPKITTGILAAAQGHAFAPQGHLERYAKGGIVNQATMFRFAKGGSFAPGVMGEAGPEAILPLQRTPSGDLGVRAVPYMRGQDKTPLQVPFRRQDEDFTTGSTEGAIRFESTVINSQEFVTRDEAERIGQAAASRGAQIAQRRMKNNPQVRRSLGIA